MYVIIVLLSALGLVSQVFADEAPALNMKSRGMSLEMAYSESSHQKTSFQISPDKFTPVYALDDQASVDRFFAATEARSACAAEFIKSVYSHVLTLKGLPPFDRYTNQKHYGEVPQLFLGIRADLNLTEARGPINPMLHVFLEGCGTANSQTGRSYFCPLDGVSVIFSDKQLEGCKLSPLGQQSFDGLFPDVEHRIGLVP